jgi:hypothetical protein
MVEFEMQKARSAGCCKMVLSSNLQRTDAHELHESVGFRRHSYSFAVDLD